MSMARSHRGSFPVRGPRRLTAWSSGTGGVTATSFVDTTPAFVGTAIQATIEGLTVIRTRGFFDVRLTLATSANDRMSGAFGIGIASLAAVTAGIASVPTPFTEQAAENWLYWQGFTVAGAQAFSAGGGPGMEQAGTFFRFEIDSRAMRKFAPDQALYAAAEIGAEVGTASCAVFHDSRMLFKLP